ncbi:MAG: hypothetical protein JWR26_1869, partial [Pedosphaera sp.]|nr:hypothetical protein [Pedosphaera sp.]
MDSGCPTPLFITGGMNINKNSSWKEERDLQQEVTEVLAHSHCWGAEFGERGREAKARGCWSTTTMDTATGRPGWRGGMDFVDGVDGVDGSEQKDRRGGRAHLDQGGRGVWQANARPLSMSIQPYLGVSRSVPPFSDLFFVLADCHHAHGHHIMGRHEAALGRNLGAHWADRQRISAGLVRPNASLCPLVPARTGFFSKVLSG